jgi:DNA-binding CsgD family transcriptional regulator
MGIVMQYDTTVRERAVVHGAQVLLHEEPVFATPARTELPTQPSLLLALIAAENAAERQKTVTTLLHALGFEWLGYGRFSQRGEAGTPLSFCTTYADTPWAERYFGARHHEVDPRLQRALQSCLPAVWTLDQLVAHAAAVPDDARLHRFVAELGDTGMRSGVMLALPGASPTDRHIVSLLSRTPGNGWMGDGLLGQVLTLALCLHEFYTRYAPMPEPLGVPSAAPTATAGLTALQREILGCVSQGLGDKAIAAKLGIGLHNVDYHLRQLRKRFGVRNRVQLMQAVQKGDGT